MGPPYGESSTNTPNQALGNMVLGDTRDSLMAGHPTAWPDVRDLALAHVEAAYIRPETSNMRFVVYSPEKSGSSTRLR